MKKILTFGLVITLLCLCLTGCGDSKNAFGGANGEINLTKELQVQDYMVAEFESDKYDFAEFQSLVNKEVTEFNTTHGEDAIVVNTLTNENNQVQMQMTYLTSDIYMTYHAGELTEKGGTILRSGYLKDADATLLSGSFVDRDGNAVNLSELATGNGAEYRYLYCDFAATLYGEGEIVAYTSGATYTHEGESLKVTGGTGVLAVYRN